MKFDGKAIEYQYRNNFTMSSLINSLKSEIARVARKELKDELLGLRKVAAVHRAEIASLKRLVKTLAEGRQGFM